MVRTIMAFEAERLSAGMGSFLFTHSGRRLRRALTQALGVTNRMSCVSLIFTVHEELGLANASELHAILSHLRPEVIFLEVPAAAFDDFYVNRTRRNLESDAVNLLLRSHPGLKLIPVDLPTPAREFFEGYEQLGMRIRETSLECRQLARVDLDRQRVCGFSYLNSDDCDQHWTEMRKEVLGTLQRIGDSRLNGIQDEWDKTNELRELEILVNVRQYCLQNHFERAVLLVGAAHRRSLTEKLQAQSEINWSRL